VTFFDVYVARAAKPSTIDPACSVPGTMTVESELPSRSPRQDG
jgi:hypothetical protein